MQGIRDTLAGKKSAELPGERLTGQNGEVAGCPLYTNDDFPLSVQQMEDILAKYPKLDAFTLTGGFPQFVPDAYEKLTDKYKDRIADGSLALVVAHTLPVQIDLMKKGLSSGQACQPLFFETGIQGHVFPEGHQGRQAWGGADPFTGLDAARRRPPTLGGAAEAREKRGASRPFFVRAAMAVPVALLSLRWRPFLRFHPRLELASTDGRTEPRSKRFRDHLDLLVDRVARVHRRGRLGVVDRRDDGVPAAG